MELISDGHYERIATCNDNQNEKEVSDKYEMRPDS